ncbi:MAG: hypothetical protein RL477_799 [Pseudomonadota bacterium]
MPLTRVEREPVTHFHASSATAVAAAAGIVPVAALVAVTPLSYMAVAVSLGAIAGAAIAALIAAFARAPQENASVSAWDVAGILAFVGFGAGMVAGEASVLKFLGLS